METLLNRLKKNYAQRKKYLNQARALGAPLEAFRLYEKDIPEYPYIIDIYLDYAVIFEKGSKEVDPELRNKHLEDVQKALCLLPELPLSPDHLVLKERRPQNHQGDSQYQKLNSTGRTLTVQEGPAHFEVNLNDYLDTGLFLDHRPLRKKIFRDSKGKKVLNLFSYTGSISVCAALGEALQVCSVDMSKTYQEWAQRNFTNNGLDPRSPQYSFITEDVFAFMSNSHGSFNRHIGLYDIVILDPPTFSNSKRMQRDFEVERDQELLIKMAIPFLKKEEGILYFSNNKKNFKLNLPTTSPFSEFLMRDITKETIPFDYRNSKIHSCFLMCNKEKK